jgi:hypothetical protein
MFRKVQNVMGVQVSASIVATMLAGKLIPQEDVIAPALQFSGKPDSSSFKALAIHISGCSFAARSALARYRADLCAGFHGMLFSNPVARACESRRPHLDAALL